MWWRRLGRLRQLRRRKYATTHGGSGGGSTPPPDGGSGGGSTPPPVANGAGVSTKGAITAFGSVVVNGVHYDVNSALITRNGASVTQAQLAVGQIARVSGDRATTNANSVDVNDPLVGPITSIDVAGGSLVALGQTVVANSLTSFDKAVSPPGLDGLNVGDVIEVSGFAGGFSAIVATRIERESSTTFQVTGTVESLDTTAHTFKINALTVDFSSATISNFTGGAPANSDIVDVEGTTFDAVTTTLAATHVAVAHDETSDANDGDDVEREGLITRFLSATDFDVADKPVTTTSTTEFEGGTTTDLALNVHVEAEGQRDANGVLVAKKMEIRGAGIAELRGNVTAVDAAGSTVMLLGVTVKITSETRFEDKSDAGLASFDLTDVAVGDTIHVRTNPFGNTATRLEREAPSTDVVVGGPIHVTPSSQLMIDAVPIDASDAQLTRDWTQTLTSRQFLDAVEHDLTSVAFAFGTWNGTTVDATNVMLSTDNDREDQDAHSTAPITDTTPDPFSFSDQTNVAMSVAVTSNAVTIAGVTAPSPITVSGGTYSVGCGATFTASSGTINAGQTVCVRHTSSANANTPANTTLTIGGVSDTFTSTTGMQDTTPDPFSFSDQTNVAMSVAVTSNAVTISGINAPSPITVSGGTYSVGCGATFTASSGTINAGQTVCVRHTSSANANTPANTTLTIGGVSDTFTSTTTSTTGMQDTTPVQFRFLDQTNVATSAAVTSNAMTISGINAPSPITVSGGTYSVGCGATFTASSGTINAGQTVCVRHMSSVNANTQQTRR